MRSRISLLLLAFTFLLARTSATASIAYGSINNFDTVNDTGHECHGFEIEIEDCTSLDVSYTYNYNHYGVPRFEQDDTVPGHPKCRIRWESKKNADGSWAAFYGHSERSDLADEWPHVHQSEYQLRWRALRCRFQESRRCGAAINWLIDNGSGALVRGGAVQVSTPHVYLLSARGSTASSGRSRHRATSLHQCRR